MSALQTLSISERHGTLRFLHGSTTVFEGAERGGKLAVNFKRNCGVRADFPLEGARTVDGFELSGSGTVFVGDLTLPNATVKASPSGVVVDVPAGWANRINPLRFMLGAKPGSWCGIMELNEPLQSLIVSPPTLRVSLAFEMSRNGIPVRCLATAELDEAKVEVSLTRKLREHFPSGLSEFRRLLLTAVAEKLTEELILNENQFSADPDEFLFEEESQQVYWEQHAQPPGEPTPSGSSRGYVERREMQSISRRPGYIEPLETSARLASSKRRPGYIEPLEAAGRTPSKERIGYLPMEVSGGRSRSGRASALPREFLYRPPVHSGARRPGYIEPLETARRMANLPRRPGYIEPLETAGRFASSKRRPGYIEPLEAAGGLPGQGQRGYVPMEVAGKSHLRLPARGRMSTREAESPLRRTAFSAQRGSSDSKLSGEDSLLFASTAYTDAHEAIAYRILWCKDILRAIGNATSQDC